MRGSTGDLYLPRFPLAEGHFADAIVQPYIHNCSVIVLEKSQVHNFMVFFKNHRRLPINRSLRALQCEDALRGDVLVMRSASRNLASVVNMRGRDSVLADFVVKRSVLYELAVPRAISNTQVQASKIIDA